MQQEKENTRQKNLWDQIHGNLELTQEPNPEITPEPEQETVSALEETSAEPPAPKRKRKKPAKRWLISGIAAVLVLTVGLTLAFSHRKPAKPQPEELVSVWLCMERIRYDAQGKPLEKILYTYDKNGNQLEYAVHIEGEEITRSVETYDEENRPLERVTYNGGQEGYRQKFTWNIDGNLEKVVRTHRGNPYSTDVYIYDWNGKSILEARTDASGKQTRLEKVYDSRGNMIREISFDGNKEDSRAVYSYDDLNRQVACVTYINGEQRYTSVISYNPDGTEAMRQYRIGEETQHHLYLYDANGNQTARLFYLNANHVSTVIHDYDEAGNVLGVVSVRGEEEQYRYSYNYDSQGRMVEMAYQDKDTWHSQFWAYNQDGTVQKHESRIFDKTGSHILTENYSYDEHGNCVEITGQQVDGESYRTTMSYVEVKVTPQRAQELKSGQPDPARSDEILYGEIASSLLS